MPQHKKTKKNLRSLDNALSEGPSRGYRTLRETAIRRSLISFRLSEAERYRYLPLDRERKEIRLLILEPGSDDDMLECTLEHTFLDILPSPLYETISYVCGNQKRRRKINLHGSEVLVPRTSKAALRCMRLKDKPRTLWIDSICINQADIDERGHQVGMMHTIYTQTFRNLIWLGRDDGTMAKVMESMAAILDEIAAEAPNDVDFGELLYDQLGDLKLSRVQFSIDIEASALLEFFANVWFTRLWVVQEASLSPSSICHRGEFQLPLASVLRVAVWLHNKMYELPAVTMSLTIGLELAALMFDSSDKTHGRFYNHPIYLHHCLYLFRGFNTSDRKDSVFATLGLWQLYTKAAMVPSALMPDYKLSVCQVYTNAVRFAIQESEDLALFDVISEPHREKDHDSWPSWVPVLDRMFERQTLRELPRRFTADDDEPMNLINEADRPNDLIVSGIRLDTVTKYIQAPNSRLSTDGLEASLNEIEALPSESWVKSPIGGSATIVGQVLVAGAMQSVRTADQDTVHRYRCFNRYLEHYRAFPPSRSSIRPDTSDADRDAALYWDALNHYASNRIVFHTTDGLIGLGPQCTQPGDTVAILYGCKLPVVMRPLPKQGEFQLLGISYVYGIMDGEAVKRHEEMKSEDTVFCIV